MQTHSGIPRDKRAGFHYIQVRLLAWEIRRQHEPGAISGDTAGGFDPSFEHSGTAVFVSTPIQAVPPHQFRLKSDSVLFSLVHCDHLNSTSAELVSGG
jgi:hypothetical protein